MRRLISTSLLGLVLAAFLLPSAKADMFDKRTILTVHETIQIPGMVLDPGTYVMKRTIPRTDPDIISFLNRDEDEVLATVHAIPVERQEATGESVFLFDEARGTEPKALKVWYYPGEITGAEFVYPKDQNLLAMNTQEGEFIGGLAPKTESSVAEPAPSSELSTEAESGISIAVPEPEPQAAAEEDREVEIAQARPEPQEADEPAAAADEPETLPATGGILPLLALMGAAAAVGGAGLRKLYR